MNEIWQTVITALSGYPFVFFVGLLGTLLGWIGKHLLVQEKGKIQKDVNKDNAELLATYQKELAEIKARFTFEESVRQTLTGSFSNAQSKVFGRRLHYIEELWKAFYVFRNSMPSFLVYVDVILEKEYQEWIKRTDIQEVFGDLSMEEITKMSASRTDDIEKTRPFVGEYLWSLYCAYRSFSFRLVLFIFTENRKDVPKHWKKDSGLNQILRSVLSESEFDRFTSKEINSIRYVQTLMEGKFLSRVEGIITGKSSIQEGAEQTKTIMCAAQRVTQENQKTMWHNHNATQKLPATGT